MVSTYLQPVLQPAIAFVTVDRNLMWLSTIALLILVVRGRAELVALARGFVWQAAYAGISSAILRIRFIAIITLVYSFALFVPAQSRSLQSSLATAFYLTPLDRNLLGGFEAPGRDALLWIAGNVLVLCMSWAYADISRLSTWEGVVERNYPEKFRFWKTLTTTLLLTVCAYGLLLAPLLSSPLVDFSGKTVATLLAIATVPLAREALQPGRMWLGVAVAFYSYLSVFALAGYTSAAMLGLAAPIALMIVRLYRTKKGTGIFPTSAGITDVAAGLVFIYFCSDLRWLLHGSAEPEISLKVVIVASVWMLPGTLSAVLFKERLEGRGRTGGVVRYIALGGVTALLLTTLVWLQGQFIALLVLPALISLLIFLSLFAHLPYFRKLGAPVAIALACFGGYVIYRLAPTLDMLPELMGPPRLAKVPASQFEKFRSDWATAHRDEVNPPIILVAAAGGGVRAAAHVAMTLAAADEKTQGWVRKHVFAISGVSGGSLGAMVWTAAADEGMFRLEPGPRLIHGRSWTSTMEEYFSSDFLSPSMSRMLLHDVPIASLKPHENATRDAALTDAWVRGWRQLEAGKPDLVSQGRLEKNLDRRPVGDFVEPILMFNSTTASDGKRAVASSVPLQLPGARILDSNIRAIDAVLNSARFPIVSAVGTACADRPVNGLRTASGSGCENGYSSVTVTDGGLADNSGLESISELLQQFPPHDRKNVYVIYVTSNPDEDLPYVDGERFNPTSVIATLTAPITLAEESRAGRARDIADTVERSLPEGHFVRWGLSSRATYDRYLASVDEAMPADERESQLQRMLNSPPLGWTLDPVTTPVIARYAWAHAAIFAGRNCGYESDAAHALCLRYRDSIATYLGRATDRHG